MNLPYKLENRIVKRVNLHWGTLNKAIDYAALAVRTFTYVCCAYFLSDILFVHQANAERGVVLSDIRGSYTTVLERNLGVAIGYAECRALVNLLDLSFVAGTEETPASLLLNLAQQQYQIFLTKMKTNVIERNHTTNAIDTTNAMFEDADPTLGLRADGSRRA